MSGAQTKLVKAYAAMEQGGPLVPHELKFPEALPSEQHVEIEVEYCGLCHSDLAVVEDEWGMFPEYPVVPGHEVIGTIAAVGSEVTTLKVGQRVGLGWQSSYCGTCAGCVRGLENTCREGGITIVTQSGGFAERVRAQAKAVIPVPDSLPSNVAGPLLCAGATVFGPIVETGVKPTHRVAVVGCGGLGHIAIKYLKHWGCHVTAFTSTASKVEELKTQVGADDVKLSNDMKTLSTMQDTFDFILVTVKAELNWNPFVAMLVPNGRIHFVGIFPELKIPLESLLGSQRSASASPTASPANMKLALEFAARHKIYPQIEEFPIESINEAMKKVKDNTVRYRAVIKVKP